MTVAPQVICEVAEDLPERWWSVQATFPIITHDSKLISLVGSVEGVAQIQVAHPYRIAIYVAELFDEYIVIGRVREVLLKETSPPSELQTEQPPRVVKVRIADGPKRKRKK